MKHFIYMYLYNEQMESAKLQVSKKMFYINYFVCNSYYLW